MQEREGSSRSREARSDGQSHDSKEEGPCPLSTDAPDEAHDKAALAHTGVTQKHQLEGKDWPAVCCHLSQCREQEAELGVGEEATAKLLGCGKRYGWEHRMERNMRCKEESRRRGWKAHKGSEKRLILGSGKVRPLTLPAFSMAKRHLGSVAFSPSTAYFLLLLTLSQEDPAIPPVAPQARRFRRREVDFTS